MTDEYGELIKLTGWVLDILREPPPIIQTSDSTDWPVYVVQKTTGYLGAWEI